MRRVPLVLALAAAAAAVLAGPESRAAALPTVGSVVEGRDTETGRVVLWISGKGVSKFRDGTLSFGGNFVGTVTFVYRSTTLVSVLLPDNVVTGVYDLTLSLGPAGEVTLHPRIAASGIPPGSITGSAISDILRGDLDDAVSLGGRPPSDFALENLVLAKAGGTMTGKLTVSTSTGDSVAGVAADATGSGVFGRATDSAGVNYGVTGQSDSAAGVGVRGRAASASGSTIGVLGEAASPFGIGVSGAVTTSTGLSVGVRGSSASSAGQGTAGFATSLTGNCVGVYGESSSTAGAGVSGVASNGVGSTFGVSGFAASTGGVGVLGRASALTGSTVGVLGQVSSTDGYAVQGSASATTGASRGVFGTSASSQGYGVYGTATSTTGSVAGVYGSTPSSTGFGLYGYASSTTGAAIGAEGIADSTTGTGLLGVASATTGANFGVSGQTASTSGTGVVGAATATTGSTVGVLGQTASSAGIGVQALCSGGGTSAFALLANHTGSSGSIAVFRNNGTNVARIDKNGRGYFNGGTQTNGADFAENVRVLPGRALPQAGDVVVIDPDGRRRFAVCTEPESTLVAGIVSTKPGVIACPHDVAGDEPAAGEEIPLAVTGIVPCKVCDEGGPIRAGDLLVAASIPGHARRAPASPLPGSVIGKALEPFGTGTGSIEVLVCVR